MCWDLAREHSGSAGLVSDAAWLLNNVGSGRGLFFDDRFWQSWRRTFLGQLPGSLECLRRVWGYCFRFRCFYPATAVTTAVDCVGRTEWRGRHQDDLKNEKYIKSFFLCFSLHWLLRSNGLPLSSSQGLWKQPERDDTLWAPCNPGVEDSPGDHGAGSPGDHDDGSPGTDHGDGSSAAHWSGQDTAPGDWSNIAGPDTQGPRATELMMGNCINDIRELFLFLSDCISWPRINSVPGGGRCWAGQDDSGPLVCPEISCKIQSR